MSFLKKMFGGGKINSESADTKGEIEDYQGYKITAQPISEGGSYRVGALIEKDVDGETKQHMLIRADTVQGLEAAQEASVRKAKQVIDEQGDRIFN